MEEKKQYSTLTIDRAAFLLLRVKKAFKKKKLQRKEREKSAQFLSTCNRPDQRASCAGLESSGRTGSRKAPPPLLRSRTLPAIVVPGVSILQAQLGNYTPQFKNKDFPPVLDQKLSAGTGTITRCQPSSSSSTTKDDLSMSFADFRRKSAASRLCYAPEKGLDGTLLLRVPAPHVVAARAYRMSSTSNTPLNRLSKLLNANSTNKNQMAIVDDSNIVRRLSWERRDPNMSRLPRSSSIDSMVDTVWSECDSSLTSSSMLQEEADFLHPPEKRQSLMRTELSRPATLVPSPSIGRRTKGQRGINELPTLPRGVTLDFKHHHHSSEMESLIHRPNFDNNNLPPIGSTSSLPGALQNSNHHHLIHSNHINHKPTKKEAKLMQQRLEKLAKVNIHVHALFAAVEHGHLDKARTILESTDVDVNSLNSDRLSPLDVAVLSNNRPMVKMLTGFGAREGTRDSSENLGYHLKKLLEEAEIRIQDLGELWDGDGVGTPVNSRASFSSIMSNSTNTASAMTGCAGGDSDKQAMAWCKRAKTLKRLILGFNQVRPPDPPSLVAVDIISENSVSVRLQAPATSTESPITTKFRVQWSTKSDFGMICSEKELYEISNGKWTNIGVDGLTKGRRYFFRAACGNLKGWGAFSASQPASVVPSSWRQLDGRAQRYDQSNSFKLDHLIDDIKELRPGSDVWEHFALDHHHHQQQRRAQRKKTTIKQLFTAASKFQKNLRRGIYLACILYHEDKVLVTNEDFLPVIEIDELFPVGNIQSDLFWLMKISCNWENTKCLKTEMEKNASSKIHFRLKLLSAILQMQQSLNLNDLGRIFYKTLKDYNSSNTTLIISTINYLKSPKNVSVLNSKWLPLNKIYKKNLNDNHHQIIADVLMNSIQEQINYHQNSNFKLSKGLYLAYLKMQSSVDLIQVVVPTNSPNMLPHCKIRENPHVSAEEWEFLQRLPTSDLVTIDCQTSFLDLIISASKRLFNYMGINLEEAKSYRLYDREIIEITPEVSFMVICPCVELSCSVPGQREILLQRGDLLSLPLQIFEMIHLQTYQQELIEKYSQLSYLLELDADNANHLQREAFSNSELKLAKDKIQKLQNLQAKLSQIWKNLRWLMDVVTFSRDRLTPGIPMRLILSSSTISCNTGGESKRNLLEIPTKILNKSTGRGSWPGPESTSENPPILLSEFSKSEQHLSDSTMLSDSESTVSDFNRLVPSRSEDTLYNVIGGAADGAPYRIRAKTVSATTSPLLNVTIGNRMSGSLVSVNTATSGSAHSLSSENSDFDGGAATSRCGHPHSHHRNIPSSKITRNLSKSLTNIQKIGINSKSLKSEDGSGILQVFAAYDTGLACGTSLKLHVTSKTTAREVVDLVVKQLNMAVVLKGKEGPIYPADKLKNFCLVAVIGARERCLRDDFKPLQLQNPWKKGRLYVRLKNDVLAALEHSSKHPSQII